MRFCCLECGETNIDEIVEAPDGTPVCIGCYEELYTDEKTEE